MSSKPASIAVSASIAALLLSGGAYAASDSRTETNRAACAGMTPPGLAPPDGNELAFELFAEGVQIYTCTPPAGAAGGPPAWTLKAPEAALVDSHGVSSGRHGGGPTWEAPDGSSVVAAKVGSVAADPSSVPWLLLRATSHAGGGGRMADVTYVQRRDTSGGIAPAEGCSAASLGAMARVPYRAVYCFYRRAGGRSGTGSTTSASSGKRS